MKEPCHYFTIFIIKIVLYNLFCYLCLRKPNADVFLSRRLEEGMRYILYIERRLLDVLSVAY